MDTFDFKRIEEELQEGLKPGFIGLTGLTQQRGWSSPVFGNIFHISTIRFLSISTQCDYNEILKRNIS